MSFELIFIYATGAIGLLVFILSISTWFFLSSLGAKISHLEDEIEKKTLELETLRKEKTQHQDGVNQPQNDPEPFEKQEMGQVPTYQNSQSHEIEIVRNVRGGGFENYEAASAKPVQQQPVDEPPTNEILDVVEERQQHPSSQQEIKLTLFSNRTKDTDFASAWKHLAMQLPQTQTPRVILDFNNIMFLYDKELQYLDKIKNVVISSGGSLSFINCDYELKSTLQQNPALACYLNG